MKKKKIVIIGSVMSVLLMVIGVNAVNYLYTANNVTYSSSSLSGNNVQDALDNLNNKFVSSTTICPSGMTCTQKTNIKCRRATTLHTEICNQTDTSHYCSGVGYSSGSTITYGNQTVTEGVLTIGDAFDCNVDGTGYNHRFYYVSDYYDTTTKNFNDKVAVLIYYSNVRGGVANTEGTSYATPEDCQTVGTCTYRYGCSWYGPVTSIHQLPTTTQWSNIRLYKDTRQILTQKNGTETSYGTLPTAFSYVGYAARFLTYQEAYSGCNSYNLLPSDWMGIVEKCQFLMEGTTFSDSSLETYGTWLETAYPSQPWFAMIVNSYVSNLYSDEVDYTSYGARPTIEVLKSEISY